MASKTEWFPEAEEEYLLGLGWYLLRGKALGRSFQRAIADAERSVAEAPNRWPPDEAGTRRCRLEGFPYALVYMVEDGVVLIVAVMHLKRRPGYWAKRLQR